MRRILVESIPRALAARRLRIAPPASPRRPGPAGVENGVDPGLRGKTRIDTIFAELTPFSPDGIEDQGQARTTALDEPFRDESSGIEPVKSDPAGDGTCQNAHLDSR